MSWNNGALRARELWSPARERSVVLPVLAFVLTLITTTLAGADLMFLFRRNLPITLDFDRYALIAQSPSLWMDGLQFSLPLLVILMAHELGHFLACSYYQVFATFPYFIPAPTPIGTMGAFIRIKSPIVERRALFDIAIAGPIAGFLCLLPILLIGITYSHARPGLARESDLVFGTPPLIHLLTIWKFPGVETHDIYLHPMARGAWVGLLATALNLLPIGQLDGGHLVYALTGEFAKAIYWIGWIGLLVLAAFYSWQTWLVWALLMLVVGLRHPRIYDTTPLGAGRAALAVFALAMFLLSFSATPIQVGS